MSASQELHNFMGSTQSCLQPSGATATVQSTGNLAMKLLLEGCCRCVSRERCEKPVCVRQSRSVSANESYGGERLSGGLGRRNSSLSTNHFWTHEGINSEVEEVSSKGAWS